MDDFVVIASDGLWDYVTNAEAVEIVREAAYEDGDPESSSDRLIQVNIFISSLSSLFYSLLKLELCFSS